VVNVGAEHFQFGLGFGVLAVWDINKGATVIL
jgi:hypothetical protein